MIPEFIDFCKELFPSISPYTRDQAKRAMEQFENLYGNPKLVAHPKDAELYQGDIYTEIPFLYTNENGEQTCIMRKAQLLTNTCDAVRDDNLIFAAIHPCEEFSKTAKDLVSIKGNHTFRLFYIPDPETQDLLIDFSLLDIHTTSLFHAYQHGKEIRFYLFSRKVLFIELLHCLRLDTICSYAS